jgi:hypothetical protein
MGVLAVASGGLTWSAAVCACFRTVQDGQVKGSGKTDASLARWCCSSGRLTPFAHCPGRSTGRRSCSPCPGGGVINLSNFRRRVWQDALEAARLERRPIYEMRHSFATLALAAGAPLEWISKQMGTPRYSGDAPALRAVLARR